MKLVLITQDYPYGFGEPFLETEIPIASKYFSEVYIISLSKIKKPCREVPSNVHYYKYSKKYHFFTCFFYAVVKLFSREAICELKDVKKLKIKPNILQMVKSWIITWMIKKRLDIAITELKINYDETVFYSYWLASSAYYIASIKKKCYYKISRAHGFEIRDEESYIPFRKMIDKSLDEIAFISEYTKDEYNKILLRVRNYDESAIQTINRLGVLEQVPSVTKGGGHLDTFRIVSCSTIYSLKRIDMIIDTLALLRYPGKVEWVHIGWGEMGDEMKLYAKFKLSEKKNISYIFLGTKTNQGVIDFYRNNNVDLFINTSDSEGIPVSIMEAMSFGIPCVAREVGGNSEIIKNSYSGYLLPKDASVEKIAEKIDDIINGTSVDLLETKSIYEYYNSNYNAKINYNQFYQSILKKKRL